MAHSRQADFGFCFFFFIKKLNRNLPTRGKKWNFFCRKSCQMHSADRQEKRTEIFQPVLSAVRCPQRARQGEGGRGHCSPRTTHSSWVFTLTFHLLVALRPSSCPDSCVRISSARGGSRQLLELLRAVQTRTCATHRFANQCSGKKQSTSERWSQAGGEVASQGSGKGQRFLRCQSTGWMQGTGSEAQAQTWGGGNESTRGTDSSRLK